MKLNLLHTSARNTEVYKIYQILIAVFSVLHDILQSILAIVVNFVCSFPPTKFRPRENSPKAPNQMRFNHLRQLWLLRMVDDGFQRFPFAL